MFGIDTNLIVRYLTGDHPRQSAKARRIIDHEDTFVATTVMLESEWVLRSVYNYEAGLVADRLAAFAGLPRVTLEDPPVIAQALVWVNLGMDFADALHLARAERCQAFLSFDERFVKFANAVSSIKAKIP